MQKALVKGIQKWSRKHGGSGGTSRKVTPGPGAAGDAECGRRLYVTFSSDGLRAAFLRLKGAWGRGENPFFMQSI